jgi:hypothetical protein
MFNVLACVSNDGLPNSYFAFYGVDAEGQAAVAGHTEAPRTFAIAGEDMGLPRRERPQLWPLSAKLHIFKGRL